MLRIRFLANSEDPRPIKWPIPHPYWVTGTESDAAVLISYADNEAYIYKYWPEARDLYVIEETDDYVYTERFPKPSWFGTYDCTEDVLKHQEAVRRQIEMAIAVLKIRAESHDRSKLREPEKSMFNQWVPRLREFGIGTPEYEQARKNMGVPLKTHYQNNRHHPEHFEGGMNDMTLIDIIEMFCDWVASAQRDNRPVDLKYLQDRFEFPDMLHNIFKNTLAVIHYHINDQEEETYECL